MTSVVIVQARMKSTRLPGKVLLDLAGHPVLHHVLARAALVPGVSGVCCAIPDGPDNDPLVGLAETAGASVFRGSEEDVLGRYLGAARMLGADTILRITSDCPLIDPEVCGRVLALVEGGGVDYACNNMPPSWPHGLDCEAFPLKALERADVEATQPLEREHVTPWLRLSPEIRRANLPGPGGWAADLRWTLDFPEDLDFLHALFTKLSPPYLAGTEELLAILQSHPEIAAINSHRHGIGRPLA